MNEHTDQQARDFAADMEAFREAFPDVDQLPDPVARQWAEEGGDLVDSYRRHEQEQAVLRQNAISEARAPVRGSFGSPQTGKGKDDFLKGLENDQW